MPRRYPSLLSPCYVSRNQRMIWSSFRCHLVAAILAWVRQSLWLLVLGSFLKLMPIGMGSGWPSFCLLAWVRSIWRYLCCSKVVRVTGIPKRMFCAFHAGGSELREHVAGDQRWSCRHLWRKFGAHSQPKRLSVDSSTVQIKMVVEWWYIIHQPGEHPGWWPSLLSPAGWLWVLL